MTELNKEGVQRGSEGVKLRREHLYGQVLQERRDNGEKNLKYKYEVNKVQGDNEPDTLGIEPPNPFSGEFALSRTRRNDFESSDGPFTMGSGKAKSIIYDSKVSRVTPFSESVV